MTHIRYRADGRAHSLELCGHANYAAEGPDIVCAGLSAITYALMGFLMNLDSGAPARCRDGRGKAAIVCPRSPRADTAFELAMIGYMQIAKKYPDHVHIHISAQGGGSREQTLQTGPAVTGDSRERP